MVVEIDNKINSLLSLQFSYAYPYSYTIIEKIFDDFFMEMITNYGVLSYSKLSDKNTKLIKGYLIRIIVDKTLSNGSNKNALSAIEDSLRTCTKTTKSKLEKIAYSALKMIIGDYLTTLKIFSLTMISDKKTKVKQMRDLGIAPPFLSHKVQMLKKVKKLFITRYLFQRKSWKKNMAKI